MFEAFMQVFVFGIGLIFALIGAFIIFDHFSWQKKGRRVRANLIGMREARSEIRNEDGSQSNQMLYFPVVEYMGRGGETVRAESTDGSSSYVRMVPGKIITVLVKDEKPEQFKMVGNGALIVGVIFGLIGAGVCGYALIAFPLTIYTGIMGGLFVLWVMTKARKIIKPRAQWEATAEFGARMENKMKTERAAMPMLDANAMRAKARAYDKTARGSALMLLLVGSVFSGTGYWVLQERAGYPDEWFVPWILFGVGGLCFFGFIAQIIGGSRKRV